MTAAQTEHVDEAVEFNWKRELVLSIIRALVLLGIVKLIQKYFWYPAQAASPSTKEEYQCAWKAGQPAQLYVYLSKQPIQVQFNDTELAFSEDVAFAVPMDKPMIAHKHSFMMPVLDDKDELYAHVYLVKRGKHPEDAGPLDMSYKRLPVKRKGADKVYTKLDISILQTDQNISRALHPAMRRQLYTVKGSHAPVLYLYEDWRLKHYETAYTPEKEIELCFTLQGISWLKLQALVYFGESFRIQASTMGVLAGELEQLKEMFMETNFWLLSVTFLVSVLHSVFDFLAFKNDIAFWRGRKDFRGMSIRAVLVNALFQVIIFLYLLDQGSSWIVVGSVAVGLLIELWKVKKVVRVRFVDGKVRVEVKNAGTATDQHDTQATFWLGIVCVPLVLGYAAYSWQHEVHRSTYSFIIGTLVGFVYAFGFIAMTPQLFINYRLKSVAHLPWRVFAYKALNTFIDDLFAFVIRMPMLHRVACFRDDLLFLVYLYQRWIYPTDMARTNEFGQSFDMDDVKSDSKNKEQEEEINEKPVVVETKVVQRKKRTTTTSK